MEPITLTAIATSITTILCSEVAKEIGKEALKDGAKSIGKTAFTQFKTLLTTIRTKFQKEGVEGILNRAQDNPTEEKHQTKLRDELEEQMSADKPFAEELKALIAQLKTEPEIEQILLKGIRVKGNAQIGDIEQSSDRTIGSIKQEALVDVEVQGNLTIGSVKQKS
jgi:uncharacterized membrane protein YhiD involved in acid resistance